MSPDPHSNTKPPSRVARRALLLGGTAVLAGGGLFAANWFNVSAEVTPDALSVGEAHAKATAGEIVLVDIRRPDEWGRTGVGEGAQPLDMRRPDFVEELLKLTNGNSDRAIALICARGVRSRRLTATLTEAGFSRIIDVPEGMLGSGAGPGWLRAGLPVVKL